MPNLSDSMNTVINHTMRTLKEFAIPFFKSKFGNQPRGSQILSTVKRALEYFGENTLRSYLQKMYVSALSQASENKQKRFKNEWEVRMQVEQITHRILNEQPIVRFTDCLISDLPKGILEQIVDHSKELQDFDKQKPKQTNSSLELDSCFKNEKGQEPKIYSSRDYQNQNRNQQKEVILLMPEGPGSNFREEQLEYSNSSNYRGERQIDVFDPNISYQIKEWKRDKIKQLGKRKFMIHGIERSQIFTHFLYHKTIMKTKDCQNKILHQFKKEQSIQHLHPKQISGQLQIMIFQQIGEFNRQLGNIIITINLMRATQEEFNKIQSDFMEWGRSLQKRSWKYDQFCFSHRCKVYYQCTEETSLEKRYLCDQCFFNRQCFQHINHEIICKLHNQPIKYICVSQADVQQKEKQKFICRKCPQKNAHNCALVSCCHYLMIDEVCIQRQCIQLEKFILCPICQMKDNKHQKHEKLKMNREIMKKQLELLINFDIAQYEQLLIKAKGALNLNFLQKIKILYAERSWSTIKFLDAFSVYNNKGVQKQIDQFIAEGKKDDLLVIREVQRMKKISPTEESRINYLQAINSMIKRALLEMLKQIEEIVEQFCRKIQQLEKIGIREVEAELNQNYKSIVKNLADDKIGVSPRLSDVNPIHRSRIQRITVVKDREAQRDDKIRNEFRDKRGKFFKQQIRRKLIEAQVGAQQQKQIIQLFSKAKRFQFWSLAYELKEQNTLYKYRTTIESLSQSQEKIQKQFAAKLGECWPWSLMVSNEFSSLRVLRIQYAPKYRFDNFGREEYYYSIDAFALFGFINGNAQLQSVALKGVQISKMQQFVETLNPNNHNKYLMRMREENKWLKARRPWTNLRLTLQSEYKLHSYISIGDKFNASTFAFRLSALSYFGRQFQSLSGMTVVIRFEGEEWSDHLEGLLQCLRAIKEIKIETHWIQQTFLLLPLLKGLSSFTEINSLAFEGIENSRNSRWVSAASICMMEESLSFLYKNNAISHLRLHRCSSFPAIPRITTLQSIDLNLVSFQGEFDLGELVKANRQLRLIRIQQMFIQQYKCEIGEETLNQLQFLSIDIRHNGLRFGPISSPSPSKLKYLSINNQNRINANSLKPIFAKLAHLTQLRLRRFEFGYKLLSFIPSNILEELIIWQNNKIKDVDLQLMDCKWPYLREIKLGNCPLISERMLRLCKFKGLMQITVNEGVLSVQGRKYLRGRGIKVE